MTTSSPVKPLPENPTEAEREQWLANMTVYGLGLAWLDLEPELWARHNEQEAS